MREFVPDQVRQRLAKKKWETLRWVEASDGSFSIQADDQAPAYLTQAEWGAANMRIMSHLIKVGDIQRPRVEEYMAYMVIVHELASRYDWASVLEFDVRYREQQAGLVWFRGLTPQQQPGSYQGGEMMMKSVCWWRKPEHPEETTDLRQVTEETFHTYGSKQSTASIGPPQSSTWNRSYCSPNGVSSRQHNFPRLVQIRGGSRVVVARLVDRSIRRANSKNQVPMRHPRSLVACS